MLDGHDAAEQSPDTYEDGSNASTEYSWFDLTITFRKVNYDFEFADGATIVDLFEDLAVSLGIPRENQKYIIPKSPLLSWPPKHPDEPLKNLLGKKIMLIGSGAATSQAIQEMSDRVARRNEARAEAARRSRRQGVSRPQRKPPTTSESKYTFLQVQPLRNLPNPERSLKLLERLKNDPGIVASMRKRKFTVALLTEMEPLSNTQSSHEGTSRILGLNRNKGEAIELRLRTDAYDGYRDYKTIRRTLCHELAHNVHSDHDQDFWNLYHNIEREVHLADWKSGGRTIGETSAYHISGQTDFDEEEFAEDHGGWTGGEFVLGGVREEPAGMSRREILARAATERQRKDDQAEQKADKGWRPCQRPHRSDDNE